MLHFVYVWIKQKRYKPWQESEYAYFPKCQTIPLKCCLLFFYLEIHLYSIIILFKPVPYTANFSCVDKTLPQYAFIKRKRKRFVCLRFKPYMSILCPPVYSRGIVSDDISSTKQPTEGWLSLSPPPCVPFVHPAAPSSPPPPPPISPIFIGDSSEV